MDQGSFEQALLALIRRVPEQQRMVIFHTVQLLVGRHVELDRKDGQKPYSIEQHRGVRQLTATIRGNMAAAIAAERDERG